MSSSIVTWTGHRSAKERAAMAWGAGHGERIAEQEQQRHERLMAAIRKLKVAEHEDRAAREEPRDMYRWRKAYEGHLKKQLRDTCRTCLGTGEITVSDGHGCVDFDECPRCSWFEPYVDDYPTEDDEVGVAF